ncbi:MAG TPA: PilZ domain-containing protein [Anaerolineaceae bacterium]|nr:PilZ domain-containing protein [Anaerolineaceae bacterium]
MKSNLLPGDNRNAIRLTWKRPVYILTPIKKPAQAINVSATGILITTHYDDQFKIGQEISLSIPHAVTKVTTTVRGKIVRMIQHNDWLQIAVDLISE